MKNTRTAGSLGLLIAVTFSICIGVSCSEPSTNGVTGGSGATGGSGGSGHFAGCHNAGGICSSTCYPKCPAGYEEAPEPLRKHCAQGECGSICCFKVDAGADAADAADTGSDGGGAPSDASKDAVDAPIDALAE